MCLLPAAISCSTHAVPADLLAPSEQPGCREARVEQVSRQLSTFTLALGSGGRASFSVTGAKSILENPIKPRSVGRARMAAPFLALSPTRSAARSHGVPLNGLAAAQEPCLCALPARLLAAQCSLWVALVIIQLFSIPFPAAAVPPPLQTVRPHLAGAPCLVL